MSLTDWPDRAGLAGLDRTPDGLWPADTDEGGPAGRPALIYGSEGWGVRVPPSAPGQRPPTPRCPPAGHVRQRDGPGAVPGRAGSRLRRPACHRTRASLEQRGAFTSLGVDSAFRQFWPGLESSLAVHAGISEMMASVYAETGRQQGWLDLDRALTRADFDELTSAIPGWCQQGRTLTEVLAAFGPPSVRGSSNARWPTTILYATDHRPIRACPSTCGTGSPAPTGRQQPSTPSPCARICGSRSARLAAVLHR